MLVFAAVFTNLLTSSVPCLKDVANPPAIYLYGEAHDLREHAKAFLEQSSKTDQKVRDEFLKMVEDEGKQNGIDLSSKNLQELAKQNFHRNLIFSYEAYSYSAELSIESSAVPMRKMDEASVYPLEPSEPKRFSAMIAAYPILYPLAAQFKAAQNETEKDKVLDYFLGLLLKRFYFLESKTIRDTFGGLVPPEKNTLIDIFDAVQAMEARKSSDDALRAFLKKVYVNGLEPTIDGIGKTILKLAETYEKNDKDFPKEKMNLLKAFIEAPSEANLRPVRLAFLGDWRDTLMARRIQDLYCKVAVPQKMPLHIQFGSAHLQPVFRQLKLWADPESTGKYPMKIIARDFPTKKIESVGE